MADVYDIQYDGTFYVVPKIFYQLFTIFLSIGRNSFLNNSLQAQCLIGKEGQGMHSSMFTQESDFMDAGSTIHKRYGKTYRNIDWPRVIEI